MREGKKTVLYAIEKQLGSDTRVRYILSRPEMVHGEKVTQSVSRLTLIDVHVQLKSLAEFFQTSYTYTLWNTVEKGRTSEIKFEQ